MVIKANQSSASTTIFLSGPVPSSVSLDEYAPVNMSEYDHWLIAQHQLRQGVISQVNTIRCNQHFVPAVTGGCSLGTDAYKWSNVYATRLNGAMFPTTAGTYALRVQSGSTGITYSWVSI